MSLYKLNGIEQHEKARRMFLCLPPLLRLKYTITTPTNQPTKAEDQLSAIADGLNCCHDGLDRPTSLSQCSKLSLDASDTTYFI